MNKNLFSAALVLLLMTLVAVLGGCQSSGVESPATRPARSMKGFELYSWQAEGEWHFALVVGTNRSKTHEEIASS